MPVFLLSDTIEFPPPHLASEEGLLAVGGDLSQKRLLLAYRMGIFPWFSNNEPILWWSPDPRLVLYPHEFKISKTIKKIIKKEVFKVTMDLAFNEVINQCAQVRLKKNQGTWIVKDMIDAYCNLHESGFAHSVEVWQGGDLAGGLYGVSLGKCFFGESMFTRVSNASNIGLVKLLEHLKKLSFDMIDCQVATEHLTRFGARQIPRIRFLNQLEKSLKAPTIKGKWDYKV
ncbi:MAG: leucyl/phenylalanyl-tRNA--protein transferase [Desulfobacteraceae bacterium]|nr:leucyl/phenylalanyl-tRNA--protein transferase [Desulfobacteraceae bacterium]MDH3574958.1 leucyl/phenylalanyl-tRNA--protein transferase [Desulfobacteraceae bacterium]MDH3839079.1 leucyl/phenylalanyl-tRNA--protein transferase [Desulfobacteraceae bacterium]MDH3874818.1 leucyl/phenylalanyl-tRNA--protein transferase [Desulfobacteraceae bacterium]MDH3882546.1 leucyl/phenylalanyl-tRNA--protein transferase [Desulfobacteraceae bacterium]